MLPSADEIQQSDLCLSQKNWTWANSWDLNSTNSVSEGLMVKEHSRAGSHVSAMACFPSPVAQSWEQLTRGPQLIPNDGLTDWEWKWSPRCLASNRSRRDLWQRLAERARGEAVPPAAGDRPRMPPERRWRWGVGAKPWKPTSGRRGGERGEKKRGTEGFVCGSSHPALPGGLRLILEKGILLVFRAFN